MNLNLTGAIVAGLPLIAIVTGLVQFLKQKLGMSGKPVEVLAITTGTLIGFGFHVYAAATPIEWTFGFVFEALIFGLALGLAATGIYDAYAPKEPEPQG